MPIRILSALAIFALVAQPAIAQSVTPADVLAAKGKSRGAQSFSARIARVGSIMGPEFNSAAPLRIPKRPNWTRAHHREADAAAGLR